MHRFIVAALAVLVLASSATAQSPEAQHVPCVVTQVQFGKYVRAVYQRPEISRKARARLRWMKGCAASKKARVNMKREQHRQGVLRWRRLHYWEFQWKRLATGDRQWALNTAFCETGGTMSPTIHNDTGTYHGLGQFDLRTWGEAGGSGDPHNASREEQLVRMVWLMKRVGNGRWPVCGH